MTSIPSDFGSASAATEKLRKAALIARRPSMILVLVLMLVIAAAAPRIFITIPSGHSGVLWLRFFGGTNTTGPALGEGLHVIAPWDHIFIYDTRIQAQQRNYEVISSDGLHFEVSVTLRWRLEPRNLPRLHQRYGPNYVEVLLLPEIGAVARERIAQYTTEDVYSLQRSKIQQEIYGLAVSSERTNAIGPRQINPDNATDFVSLIDVLITDMMLSPRIKAAVEHKVEQLMVSQEYRYRLITEQEEAERKKIEAEGIQAFQQTVQKGITNSYLKWRGIEATLKLAESPNAKVVVIGGGSQGLPLILNTDGAATPDAPQTASASARTASAAGSSAATKADPESHLKADSKGRTTDGKLAAPQVAQALAGKFGYRLDPLGSPPPKPPTGPVQKPQ